MTFGASAEDDKKIEIYSENETIKIGDGLKDDIGIDTVYMYDEYEDTLNFKDFCYAKYYVSSLYSSKMQNIGNITFKIPCKAQDGYVLLYSKELNASTEYNYSQLESEYIDGKYVFNMDIPKGTEKFEGYLVISKKPLSEINGSPVQQTLTSEIGVTVSGKFPKDTVLNAHYSEDKSYFICISNVYFHLGDCSAKINIPCNNKDTIIKLDNGYMLEDVGEAIFNMNEDLDYDEEPIDELPLDEYKAMFHVNTYQEFVDLYNEIFPTIKSEIKDSNITFDYDFKETTGCKNDSSLGTLCESFYVGTEKELYDEIYPFPKEDAFKNVSNKSTDVTETGKNNNTLLITIGGISAVLLLCAITTVILIKKRKNTK